jgi:hypothetical protein
MEIQEKNPTVGVWSRQTQSLPERSDQRPSIPSRIGFLLNNRNVCRKLQIEQQIDALVQLEE